MTFLNCKTKKKLQFQQGLNQSLFLTRHSSKEMANIFGLKKNVQTFTIFLFHSNFQFIVQFQLCHTDQSTTHCRGLQTHASFGRTQDGRPKSTRFGANFGSWQRNQNKIVNTCSCYFSFNSISCFHINNNIFSFYWEEQNEIFKVQNIINVILRQWMKFVILIDY